MKSLYHENTHPSGALLLWYPPLPAAQGTGKKCAQLPYHTLQGSMMMRTRGNLYFKDVIPPNEKIISALTWQLLVASIIHIHCLYPLQLRKQLWQHLEHHGSICSWTHSSQSDQWAVTPTAQWPPEPSTALGLQWSSRHWNHEPFNTNKFNSFISSAPFSHFWFCCIYIFCHLQCQDDSFMYFILSCSESTPTA